MPVNPKQAKRRSLSFHSLDDILTDAQAVTAGLHITTGNHSAAELIHHVAYFIDRSTIGFDFRAPAPLRLIGWVIKKIGLDRPIAPGTNPPQKITAHFWPDPNVSLDEALAYLQRATQAARAPDTMTQPSPLFGKLTHDQWTRLHCRHAELHLSFIHPVESGPSHP